ncbi:hypothetical protein L21SP3_00881 [Sedimentisphaera cyanobacteriorum]|uniref:Flagellin N-methylase n=1 Tax=Sedimentisphaera cyanobacteriorum TaxID=1940790 RepID=A0A1Q2HPD3_9BACT|nr:YkgJ family cysteine cluster protein [Sedimentisphaera cyanobacteriorum]AQQ09083.1 hypothetical protein L21SP3_00881 [Sedimentisphaera cyanobacteriorum]
MTDKRKVLEEVVKVYASIERRLSTENIPHCRQCGSCCNFARFGHRLYVSTPEIMYFRHYVPAKAELINGKCPYLKDSKCSVHKYRFAGCRVFNCMMSEQLQSEISEFAVKRFRNICDKHGLEYQYIDLEQALQSDIH